MSKEQHPQAEELRLPSDLTVNVRILGVGRFQGRNETVTFSQLKKALYIVPDKNVRHVSGVWVPVVQISFYQMDVVHGLLYMGFCSNIAAVELTTGLLNLAQNTDLLDSRTELRGPALRMWLEEDVNPTFVMKALTSIGVPYHGMREDQDFATDMFVGIKIPVRQDVPLRKGTKRGSSPDNRLTKCHAHLLLQRVTMMYDSGTASDCKLISRDGKEFMAHRGILAAWSPVFGSMFSADMVEKASGVCRLENFDGHVVKALLSFVYTGVLPDIDEIVEDVLDMANQYEIPDLRVACEEKLAADLTTENAPRCFHLAAVRGLGSLKTKTAKFVADHVGDF